jgi:hypothetical protein
MINRHQQGVLNYFTAARITNAAAEGLKVLAGYSWRPPQWKKMAVLKWR